MYCPQSRINEKKYDYGILSNVNHYDLLDVVRCFYSTNITYYYQTDYDKKYRFGFNGQEKDDEVAGAGNTNTAMFWEYDTRLGRRWNIDPVIKEFESPYLCFSGNPIFYIDINGDNSGDYWKKNGNNYEKVGTDGINDKKNYVLKIDEELKENVTPTNFTDLKAKFVQMPSLAQRQRMMDHWFEYNKIKKKKSISDSPGDVSNMKSFTGAFHEEGGWSEGESEEIHKTKGEEVVPSYMGEIVTIDQGNLNLNSNILNLIYHFHATAKTTSSTNEQSRGEKRLPDPPYLYLQAPSIRDFAGYYTSSIKLMKNGGAILQVSRGTGITFIGIKKDGTIGGVLIFPFPDNLDSKLFSKPFPNEQ